MSFGGSVRIDGQLDGEITATGTLVMGETAVITTPRIKAASVIVAGKVNGDIVAVGAQHLILLRPQFFEERLGILKIGGCRSPR